MLSCEHSYGMYYDVEGNKRCNRCDQVLDANKEIDNFFNS